MFNGHHLHMTSQASTTPARPVLMAEQPDTRVIDKPRVLAHLQQQLAELKQQEEAKHGNA
jgi:hypothetical protein